MADFKNQMNAKLNRGIFQLYNNATQNGRHVRARDDVTSCAEPL